MACGTVDIPIASARLVLELDSAEQQNRVEFHCPGCHTARSERVGERATRLLSNAGITVAAPAPPPAAAHDDTGEISDQRRAL